ncbi:hypothetical protein Tco_0466256 [Tanacetum coccineum]
MTKPTEDDQEKSKVIKESDSTIPDPSHQTVTSNLPVIAPFTDVSSISVRQLVNTPSNQHGSLQQSSTPLPESLHSISLQLKRVAKIRAETSEESGRSDHFYRFLGFNQNPNLIEKYSALPGPEIKNANRKSGQLNSIPCSLWSFNKQHERLPWYIEVAVKVKTTRRKHDSDDEEDGR